MKAAKAHAAGIAGPLTLVLLYLLAPTLGIEPPPIEDYRQAVVALIGLVVTGAVGWVSTYAIRNKEF